MVPNPRLGLITRVKGGKTKKRIILDLKQSKVSASTHRTHRVVLPRFTDLLQAILDAMAALKSDEDIEV